MDINKTNFETLQYNHLEGIVKLCEAVFGIKKNASYFNAFFDLENQQFPSCSTVAIIEGEIIGLFGARLIEYQKEESQIIIAESVYSMIHPQIQRRGIFEKLFEQTISNLREANIPFIYGYPNEKSLKFCLKNGFFNFSISHRYHIQCFPLNTSKLIRVLKLEQWQQKRVERIFKPFWSNVDLHSINIKNNFYTALYNDRFIRMKADKKFYLIELSGYLCTINFDRHLTIGSLKKLENSNPLQFVKQLKQLARKSGVNEIVFHMVEENEEKNELRKILKEEIGFYLLAYPILPNAKTLVQQFNFNFLDSELF